MIATLIAGYDASAASVMVHQSRSLFLLMPWSVSLEYMPGGLEDFY